MSEQLSTKENQKFQIIVPNDSGLDITKIKNDSLEAKSFHLSDKSVHQS